MQSNDFCVEYPRPHNPQKVSGRRQSNSWDNDTRASNLSVPSINSRRDSNTLAKLLECSRSLSQSLEDPHEEMTITEFLASPPPQDRPVRRTSIAELSDHGITTKNSDDCVVLTQTLGTSTTYFFQKDPSAANLNLRPSAVERGLYNFDDMIKATPVAIQHVNTPRPSVQLAAPYKPSVNFTSCVTIAENNDSGNSNQLKVDMIARRPSHSERGLPTAKIPTYEPPARGRTLHKQKRNVPYLNGELDKIIANRRKKLEEEEIRRENQNLIRPRSRDPRPITKKPHLYDGRAPTPDRYQAGRVMDELRSQIDNPTGGEIDRIVKEKKTTTLNSNGIPLNDSNRRSITSVDGQLPSILDRPYVRAKDNIGDSRNYGKTVTIRKDNTGETSILKGSG